MFMLLSLFKTFFNYFLEHILPTTEDGRWVQSSAINSPSLPFRSFYVGDAAGRENDHSDADIKFAEVLLKSFLRSYYNMYP